MARPHAATALRLRAFAVLAGFAVGASCYSDRLPPPTFRYICGSTADCAEGEACVDGLCERTCTQATFSEDCPETGQYTLCFNGVCSHVCEVGETICAAGQRCVELPFDVSDLGGGGGGGFSGGGGEDESGGPMLGICGKQCEGDSCPVGSTCLEGFCVETCDPAVEPSTCSFDFPCQGGLCFPDLGGGDTDGGTSQTGTLTIATLESSGTGGETTADTSATGESTTADTGSAETTTADTGGPTTGGT